MNEEKMIILRMLKEDKITQEEASKLLDAIYNKDKSENSSKTNFKSENNKDWQKDFDKTIDKLEDGLSKFSEKFGEKMDKIGRELNEDSDSFADKILSSFNSFIDKDLNDILGRYEIKKENLEIEIDDIENPELNIKGINGEININPWSKDYIYVEVICHLKKNKISKENQIMSFEKLDNTVFLSPLFETDIAVKLDISLPNKKYENIILNTSNGKINILDLNSKEIKAFTKNASINLYHINSKNIKLSTKNSAININNTSLEKIFASTSNGKIKVNNINSNSIKEAILTTSNAGIFMKLGDFTNPYAIRAHTTNSHIDLNLPNLVYDYNESNENIKAHKENTKSDEQIILDLTTTNAKIVID